MKNWNELSIRDKNDIIRVAVQNGITALPDIRERYNEFAEGGEEETVERVLPEIVKRPSEKDKMSLAKMKRMLPDAESRSDMYYELDPFRHLADEPIKISQNESIDRLYDVYKQSGYPKVSNHRTIFDYLTYPFSKDLNRSSYNPITNTMHLPNSEKAKYDAEGFIPELAHAYQFHGNNADFWGNLFHIPGDIKIEGKSGYERPGHMEHTAHSIIEPAIYDYVQGYTDSFNPSSYASGGKIYIKEKNRGKFTALKKRTGHSASWFKAHGTPAQRKMATFELNARKWKHGDGGNLFDEGGETNEEYYPIWLDGVTVKPSGNRPTTRDDWNWANWRELQNEREQQAAESVRRGIDRNGTPIAAGIFGLAAAPFAIEGLGSSAVANGIRTGLQAMNTAFTPSTWLNPVTGTKLLSPTVGTIADAGIQGAFAYEGLNGLYNQGKQGTLLSDPANTVMHGLEVLPLVGVGVRGTQYMYNKAKPFMNFLWNDGNIIQRKMPYNPNNFYREVSKEAIDDAISSGVVRTGNPDRYLGPFFAKGSTPWKREKYIIEGYPNKNEWIYAEPYQNAIWLGEEYPALGKKAMEEALNHVPKPQDASIGVHIFPYTNGSVNLTPTSNFTYWQKHPIIGWRQHAFDNTARAKRAYGTPKADIMPVEGSITTGDIPNITPENAASITPEQWTAAQDAAIARGDMTEAQRLRDLHFSLTDSAIPGKYYRGTQTKRKSYPDRHIDEEVGEMNGIYLTKKPKYAKTYGDVEEFYLRSNNPLETEGSWTGVIDDATRAEIENAGYDAVVNNRFDTGFLNKLLRNSRDETITFNGKNLKLADAVTFDDDGVRIGLGNRDNFNNPDIRWGLLPWILGGGAGALGYGYLNQDQGPLVGMAMGGRLNGK